MVVFQKATQLPEHLRPLIIIIIIIHGTYFTVNSGATRRLAAVSKMEPCALLFTRGTNRTMLQARTVSIPIKYTLTNTPPSGHCHVYGK
jgi:hypothetical protein